MRAFVTGSTGLLGNNLVGQLVASGWSVIALARSVEKAKTQLGHLNNVTVVQGDLADIAGFAHHLAGVDVIFHTAAYFREYFSDGDHEQRLQALNVDAPVALAKAGLARGVKRFVHTSSSGTIRPKPDGSAGTEEDVQDPSALLNRYFASKVRADAALSSLREQTDVDVVTVLPGWMFGPGDAGPTGAGGLVRDALNNRLPPVALPGRTAVCDARDVAAAMVAMATQASPGDRFIVAGEDATLTEVVTMLAALTDTRPPLFTMPYIAALVFATAANALAKLRGVDPIVTPMQVRTLNSGQQLSSAHAMKTLGTTFRPLRETLADTVTWFRDQRSST